MIKYNIMKMKFIIVLIVMSQIVTEKICNTQGFREIKTLAEHFIGRRSFLKEYNSKEFKTKPVIDLEYFSIIKIQDGIITHSEVGKGPLIKKKTSYLSSNVVCQGKKIKHCILQYITLFRNSLYFKQIKFQYTILEKESGIIDCEHHLRTQLEEKQSCRISYIETDYQIFSVPLPDKSIVTYNSYTGEFLWIGEGKSLNLELSNIKLTDTTVSLEIGGIAHPPFTFTIIKNSCFDLLKKIYYLLLPKECPNTKFNYYSLLKKDNGIEVKSKIPSEGVLNILTKDGLRIEGIIRVFGNVIERATNFSPIYDKSILVDIEDKNNNNKIIYSFFINYINTDCLNKLRRGLFYGANSCSGEDGYLYYYKQVYLTNAEGDNGILDGNNGYVDGNIRSLKFMAEEGIAQEYDMNLNFINGFRVVEMSLKEEDAVEGDVLIIKGLDLINQIIHKKYYVKINKELSCLNKYNKIKDKFALHLPDIMNNGREYVFSQKNEAFHKIMKDKNLTIEVPVEKRIKRKKHSEKNKKNKKNKKIEELEIPIQPITIDGNNEFTTTVVDESLISQT
jgi:hypothetical protein